MFASSGDAAYIKCSGVTPSIPGDVPFFSFLIKLSIPSLVISAWPVHLDGIWYFLDRRSDLSWTFILNFQLVWIELDLIFHKQVEVIFKVTCLTSLFKLSMSHQVLPGKTFSGDLTQVKVTMSHHCYIIIVNWPFPFILRKAIPNHFY